MNETKANVPLKTIIVSLAANTVLSLTILPLLIPPFRIYSLHELGEVLLWQGIGTLGWPIAVVGGALSLLWNCTLNDLTAFLLILIYPSMLFLLICALISTKLRRCALVLLHLLLTASFAAIWYKVLNGYDFMTG